MVKISKSDGASLGISVRSRETELQLPEKLRPEANPYLTCDVRVRE